jgi:PqqD family protein of HPr-rel-A system
VSAVALAVRPRARSRELIVRGLADETLVYDRTSHQAHCLNASAGLVLAACDGRTSLEDLVRKLKVELPDLPEDAAAGFVELALHQLSEAGLLEDPVSDAAAAAAPSRRAALRVLAAGSMLPVVLSVLAPTPAEAQTCIRPFRVCTSSSQCCPQAPCCRRAAPPVPRTRCFRTGPGCIP